MENRQQKLLEFFGEEQHRYPDYLEKNFPHILQRIHHLLDKDIQLGEYLANLLKPPGPYSRGFPDEALADLRNIHECLEKQWGPLSPFTLEANGGTDAAAPQRPQSSVKPAHPPEDLTASEVFDRVVRW